MNFIRELPSFDMFFKKKKTPHKQQRATGSLWSHHSTFKHLITRVPPESSAGVTHIKYTLTDQFKNMKAHNIQHSNQIIEANTRIQHNIPLHFFIFLELTDVLKSKKKKKKRKSWSAN